MDRVGLVNELTISIAGSPTFTKPWSGCCSDVILSSCSEPISAIRRWSDIPVAELADVVIRAVEAFLHDAVS